MTRIAQSPDDLTKPEQMADLSGLEIMQKMLAGEIAGPPIAGVMNFRLDQVGPGRIVFRGTPLFDHCNPMGTVHGGWFGTILDSALGCVVATGVPVGRWYTTLEYKVNITRALRPGTEVLAEAILQHGGRSTAVASAELRGAEDGRLYATGNTTCIILDR